MKSYAGHCLRRFIGILYHNDGIPIQENPVYMSFQWQQAV